MCVWTCPGLGGLLFNSLAGNMYDRAAITTHHFSQETGTLDLHECVGQSCFRPTFLCLAAAAAAAVAVSAALTSFIVEGRQPDVEELDKVSELEVELEQVR